MGVDNIGYNYEDQPDHEVFDTEKENELRVVFNETLDESQQVMENRLEELNKSQLATYLKTTYFDNGLKSFSDIRKDTPQKYNCLMFSLKAALQLIAGSDKTKYNLTTRKPDDSGQTIDDIIKSRGGIDLDEDDILIKFLQMKVGAYEDGKPGPETLAKVISCLGEDITDIANLVNNHYKGNKNFEVNTWESQTLFGVDYKFDKNIFSITGEQINSSTDEKWYGITDNSALNKPYYEVYSNGSGGLKFLKDNVETEDLCVKDHIIKHNKRSAAPAAPSDGSANENGETPVTLQEIENTGIKINDNNELVDDNGNLLNVLETNFIGGLIDEECSSQHGEAERHSGYSIGHVECLREMEKGELTYNKSENTINYKNNSNVVPLGFNITKTSGEYPFYTITDISPIKNYSLDMKFQNLKEAINTIKLIEYIRIRFNNLETGADDPENDNCTSNSSPFFIGDYTGMLYFSPDHGGFGGAIGIYDDENIINTKNFKQVSSVFGKNSERINFAKYLVHTVDFEEEN